MLARIKKAGCGFKKKKPNQQGYQNAVSLVTGLSLHRIMLFKQIVLIFHDFYKQFAWSKISPDSSSVSQRTASGHRQSLAQELPGAYEAQLLTLQWKGEVQGLLSSGRIPVHLLDSLAWLQAFSNANVFRTSD